MKQIFLKFLIPILGIVAVLMLSAACVKEKTADKTADTTGQMQTDAVTKITDPVTTSPDDKKDPDPAETAFGAGINDIIEEIKGASDENGIYTVIITLSDKAADKGTVEMVYYGEKDSPQKDSVVNTYRIEYGKDGGGTFEIRTFYDGKVDQVMRQKAKVKVNNTFSAGVRAGSVVISYAPEGEELYEIYRADAGQFR